MNYKNRKQFKLEKINGFRCPWSIHQILIDCLFIYHVAIYFIIIFPIQSTLEKIVFTTIYCILLFLVILYTILATIQDPTQTMIRIDYDQKFKNSQQVQRKIDTIKFMRSCSVCNKGVQQKTKHCNQCNRCCQNFDHHCKFLNNCIGWNNYNYFFLLMTFVSLFLILQSVATLYKIFQYIFHSNQYSELVMNGILQMNIQDYNLLMIFSSIFLPFILFLALYLLFFHIYLHSIQLSTYDYFMKKRRQQIQRNTIKQKTIQVVPKSSRGKIQLNKTQADQKLNQSQLIFQINDQNR